MPGTNVERAVKYQPLPSQHRFHDSTARFKGFSGPIGSGKSAALCQEAIRLSYMNPGRTGLIGAPTYPMLRDATLTSLVEILHDNEVPFELNKAENVILLKDVAVANPAAVRGRLRAAARDEPGMVRAR